MISERTARFGVFLFGHFQLFGPNGPVALTSKKHRALLAYLASSHPASHSRDKLMSLLWGGHVETQARQNLRQALSSLRQLLGKEVIVSKEDSISLEPLSISCDVPRFEMLVRQGSRGALNEALDLYKDRLLAGLLLAEDGWSHWLSSEQRRFEDMALDASVRLGEAELARGDQSRAMALATRGIAMDELREDAVRLFMRAAALGGRKAEALQQYDLLVALMKRQLDTEPDAATRRLADEIRANGAVAVAGRAPLAPSINELEHLHADRTRQSARAVHALDDRAARSFKSAGDQLVAASHLLPPAAAG